MASTKAEDGLAQQSQAEVEKLNGDGDLDFTITMNESEDEVSNDDVPPSKLDQKANGTSSPAKVNGKMTSDEDSQSSLSKKEKPSRAKDSGKEKKEDEKSALKEQSRDEKRDEDVAEQERETNKRVKPDQAEKEESSGEEEKEDDEKGDQNTTERASAEDASKTDDQTASEPEEKKKERRDGQESRKDLRDDKSRERRKETADEQKDIDDDDDDDVVEIEDSSMKPLFGKAMERGGPRGGKDTGGAPFVKVSNSSVSGSNFVSYLGSVPGGTSLLAQSSGMQLVQVQGGGLMYVPNSGASNSASGVGSISKGLPQNSSLLFNQYANMMANQNRFMMSAYNQQGARSAMPPAPILTNIPDKPTSSLGMIENIRWEVENHINIKPKYAKPNPKAELGHLTKWMFDLGSDLVKEFVYHDLVRIQTSRNSEGTLSNKEKEDFTKLQEIDRELNHKIGHLKIRLNKHCKCGFRTELHNVLYNHQQHAHIERGGFFNCILCKFSTRQPSTFKFHMESMHGRTGYLENRPSFFECPLCPYETNYQNRLDQHKVRCLRQFREAFNLHPSCVTGPEVNLCLENVFYFVFTRQFMNSIMPKSAAPGMSSATKIRDMPNNEVTRMNVHAKGTPNAPAASAGLPSKQIAPKTPQTFQPGPASMRQQQQSQHGSGVSRNFPVMSSKVNAVPNQAGSSTYASGRPQAQPPQNQPPASTQPNNGFEVCEICGGYVKDRKALRIHFYYAHRIDMPFGVFERPQAPLYCATCFARFWTAQGLQKHIEVHKNDMMGTTQTSNGVAGKCISCGHRVPNILMHMRMVHNRELRHYLAAVMCIFCGNRFSTKKEVEAHMGKMHGVIVKNSSVQGGLDKPQAATQGTPRSNPQQPKPSAPVQRTAADPAAPKPSSKGKMNRSSQCVLCNLSFSRNVDLTRHCMRVHHTCMKCGLVVVDKESLARHTCLHSASGMRTCQICRESGFHPAYYIKHMRDKHLRKCSVVLRHIDRAVVETMKRPITISDSEDDESGEKPPKLQKRDSDDDDEDEDAAEEQTAAEGNDTKQGEADEASDKKDSSGIKETKDSEEMGASGKGEDEEKRKIEAKSGSEGEDHGDDGAVEKKDRVPVKKYKASDCGKEKRVGGEKSGDVDIRESGQGDISDKQAEDSSSTSDHEKQDNGKSAPDEQAEGKEDVHDKSDEESADRQKSKRKIDEVDNDEEEDSPSCKSQRRSSQLQENQN